VRGEKNSVTTTSVRAAPKSSAACFTLRDGVPMAYDDMGSGPAVLLVHGWAVNRGFFSDLANRLQSDFRVIVPDLRGHGQTPVGDASISIEQLADDLISLIEALDLSRVVALGWSMGATVLWKMIERVGADRLGGLIIEDMSPRVLNDASWSLGMQRGLDAAMSDELQADMRTDWPRFASSFSPRMFARDFSIDVDLAARLAQMSDNDREAMAALWASMTDADFRAALPEITIPTCVMHGAQSQTYSPETSRFLVESMPRAQRISFARSGHAPHLEEPEAFARAVTEFVHRTQSGGGSVE